MAVIVDDLDPDRRRRCFWEEQLSGLSGVEFQLVSLLANMESRRFFNVHEYDVVIFNWCVLDGAVMYASDRAQDILAFYDDHFFQYVRRGGVVIMENQPKRWRPAQRAYDVLFPGQLVVTHGDTYAFSSVVQMNTALRGHPLLQGIPTTINSAYPHPLNSPWFPPGSTSPRSIEELHPTKMYTGAFLSWSKGWLPLLYTDDRRNPVLLAKTEGLGLWIVSTMFLASSNVADLIGSLVVGARSHSTAIQQFHAAQERRRQLRTIAGVGAIVVLGVCLFLLLQSGALTSKIPYGDTWAGNLATSLLFALLVSGITFLRGFIFLTWRSLRHR
ncbi:hypothetical protein ACIBSR_10030 [Streptomyces sp. NPDC049936]|uniref:hypothetical protein n=1 Tax=Streptomyces sp. NPDC049936 TaxID=3365599 RepID=UPI0037AA9D9A